MNKSILNRVESVDILRGLVMIIMALDHVRDYFHIGSNTGDPLDLATTTPWLFFTRWVTHFCAPIFVFLSGTSIYLQSLRKTKKELSVFLIKRGIWLMLVEITIISFGWSFNIAYNLLFLQVIWAIGISMFLLGCLIYLPFYAILLLGISIVLMHNLLDYPESAPDFKTNFLWDLAHHGRFKIYAYADNHAIIIAYAFLPWTGLMMLGYGFGKVFQSVNRRKKLIVYGALLSVVFVVVRAINSYGDPLPWNVQRTPFFTFLSFLNVNKYPPSLLYMCMTIGPALLFLAFIDTVNNKTTAVLLVFGRVSMFYYILHLYLIHILCAFCFFLRGNTWAQAYKGESHFPFYFVVPGEGYGLPVVYLVWIIVVMVLYPLCLRYDRYKTAHKEKWWLSYL